MANNPTNYPIQHLIPYGVLIAGNYEMKADYLVQRPASHADWLLMFTTKGTGFVHFEHHDTICNAGDITILLPGMHHHYGTYGDSWSFMWVHFIPDPEWRTWLSFPHQKPLVHVPISSAIEQQHIEQALTKTVEYSNKGNDLRTIRLSMLALEETLLHLSLALPKNERSIMDPRIVETLQYLQQSFYEKISIPDLARKSCMSVSRLSHLFKEHVGDTIISTLHKLRLDKAANLLTQTNRQVSEIANDVGFDSIDHFTRLFTASYGLSPSKYRKANEHSRL